jgi:hypothetical protein
VVGDVKVKKQVIPPRVQTMLAIAAIAALMIGVSSDPRK